MGDRRNCQVATNHIDAMGTVPSTLVQELQEVRSPFLFIHETDDPLVPIDHGEASARLVPNSKLHRLQGAGHMFFYSQTWQEIAKIVAAHTHDAAHA
ncbi:MAG: alpha/beta hydrolase [Leptolyngbya sp. SIO1D8]|nr:alpha/beta hydrolase [Leptolyngbya sp. SIO1D8]